MMRFSVTNLLELESSHEDSSAEFGGNMVMMNRSQDHGVFGSGVGVNHDRNVECDFVAS